MTARTEPVSPAPRPAPRAQARAGAKAKRDNLTPLEREAMENAQALPPLSTPEPGEREPSPPPAPPPANVPAPPSAPYTPAAPAPGTPLVSAPPSAVPLPTPVAPGPVAPSLPPGPSAATPLQPREPVAPIPHPPARDRAPAALARVATDALCVTKGKLAQSHVAVPTFRAVAAGHGGDAAAVKIRVNGNAEHMRALASGQNRRQVGLKLRAENGCNLVYVMWRLDPKPKLEVSVKRNPGERTSAECGANGYTKVKAAKTSPLPSLLDEQEHELRASITGDSLTATIDGKTVWSGTLPPGASELAGPAGIRSDNLDLDILSFAADSGAAADVKVKCTGGDDESD